MADESVLNEEQKYLNEVLKKYNADNADPSLSSAEKVLLDKIVAVEKEVQTKREQLNALSQEIVLKTGQSQGLVASLLALRE